MRTEATKGRGTETALARGRGVALVVLTAGACLLAAGERLVAQVAGDPGPPTAEELHPADPADSLYRAARTALSDAEYERAAELFAELRRRFPDSEYVADSLYFEALALQRTGGGADVRRALELLAMQQSAYREAATAQDGRALTMRLRSQLAELEQELARIRQEEQRVQAELEQARRGEVARSARADRQESERARQEVQRQARILEEMMVRSRQRSAELAMRADEGLGPGGQACEDAGEGTRRAALHALLRMDRERARPLLLEVLRDSDPCSAELREQALFMVGRELDDEAVELFLDLAVRDPDPDPDVRGAAVFWLGRADAPEARAAIESILLTADEPEIQEQALLAVGRGDPARATDAIRRFLERDDIDPGMREDAIVWLGQRGGEEGLRYLRTIYETVEDADLRAAIVFGVGRSATAGDRAWLLERVADPSEDPDLRTHAAFALGRTGEVPLEELRGVFTEAADADLKLGLLEIMGRAGEGEALLETMIEIARSEEDPEVRERAIAWIGRSDDPRAADVLLELIRGGRRGGGG